MTNSEQDGGNPRAADLIDLNDEYSVRQWTEIFNVTAAELAEAVRAVGTNRADVKRYVHNRNK
jgi:hypothetical protein